VQRYLRPFNDGSRRAHAVTSPLIVHALNLFEGSTELLACGHTSRTHLKAVRYALDALANVAVNLHVQLDRWGARHSLNAYAVDIHAGDRFPAQHLAGHRTGGVISAGRLELIPVLRAVDRAQTTTLRLSRRLAEMDSVASNNVASDLSRRSSHRAARNM
jgi:hypothetical protein